MGNGDEFIYHINSLEQKNCFVEIVQLYGCSIGAMYTVAFSITKIDIQMIVTSFENRLIDTKIQTLISYVCITPAEL